MLTGNRLHKQEQPARIAHLVGLYALLRVLNRYVRKCHDPRTFFARGPHLGATHIRWLAAGPRSGPQWQVIEGERYRTPPAS